MYKPALFAAAVFAMLAVVLGAFGAHALKAVLTPELLLSFETGVKYQLYHALALLALGVMGNQHGINVRRITQLFIAGIILFSFSIYALVIMKSTQDIGLGKLGLLTPIGGVLLIAGWGLLAWQVSPFKTNKH